MHDDPLRYWQDVTENYRQMSDGQLLQLAANPEDLTDVAQQVLRDEMRLRKLDQRQESPSGSSPPRRSGHHIGGVFRDHYIPSDSELPAGDEEDLEPQPEYTWKTLLCDCESNDQAWQLREALKRHGIESWVRAVPAYSMDVLGPQLYVAADQLDAAQAIAAQPIPQDIIDDGNTQVPEFELPECPRCGSRDEITLEGTDPVNSWSCERCGAEWTDGEQSSESPTATTYPPA
jgi:hypothetical protein